MGKAGTCISNLTAIAASLSRVCALVYAMNPLCHGCKNACGETYAAVVTNASRFRRRYYESSQSGATGRHRVVDKSSFSQSNGCDEEQFVMVFEKLPILKGTSNLS